SSRRRLRLFLQQLQHRAVQLAAPPVLVIHVRAATVEDAEPAAEIPHRPTPAGLFPQTEIIAQPAQRDRQRLPVERAEFTDHHSDTLRFEFFPRLDLPFAQGFLVPERDAFLDWPGRLR